MGEFGVEGKVRIGGERWMIDFDVCMLSAAERCIGMVFGVIDMSHCEDSEDAMFQRLRCRMFEMATSGIV